MIAIEQLTQDNSTQVKELVGEIFSEVAVKKIEKVLTNPLLKALPRSKTGVVVFEDTVCVGFQALMIRALYLRTRKCYGYMAAMLCIRPGYSHVAEELLTESITLGEADLFFANTARKTTVKLKQLVGVKGRGPDSCGQISFYVTRWGTFLREAVPVLRHGLFSPFILLANGLGRMMNVLCCRRAKSQETCPFQASEIDAEQMDMFWATYLSSNDGLVVSRTAQEMNWLFADGLAQGTTVLLGRKSVTSGKWVGYALLKRHPGTGVNYRWMVADWIALKNEPSVLSDLLCDACRYAAETHAYALELIGYPESAQPIVKACLPFVRKGECNSFIYKAFTKPLQTYFSETPDAGWFWGALDGDRCL